jgi:hypothetical protein
MLLGCTVPVVLGAYQQKPGELEKEHFVDEMELLERGLRKMEANQISKAKNRQMLANYIQGGEYFQLLDDRAEAESYRSKTKTLKRLQRQ